MMSYRSLHRLSLSVSRHNEIAYPIVIEMPLIAAEISNRSDVNVHFFFNYSYRSDGVCSSDKVSFLLHGQATAFRLICV